MYEGFKSVLNERIGLKYNTRPLKSISDAAKHRFRMSLAKNAVSSAYRATSMPFVTIMSAMKIAYRIGLMQLPCGMPQRVSRAVDMPLPICTKNLRPDRLNVLIHHSWICIYLCNRFYLQRNGDSLLPRTTDSWRKCYATTTKTVSELHRVRGIPKKTICSVHICVFWAVNYETFNTNAPSSVSSVRSVDRFIKNVESNIIEGAGRTTVCPCVGLIWQGPPVKLRAISTTHTQMKRKTQQAWPLANVIMVFRATHYFAIVYQRQIQ